MMSRNTIVIVIIIVLIILGIWIAKARNNNDGKNANNSGSTTPPPTAVTPPPSGTTAGTCVRAFDANKLKTAKVDIANKSVTLSVAKFGNITVQLYDKDAPKAVENFLRLVNAGFYDCLTFHRISKGFVIQGGDPLGNGTGGESAFGGEFADELNPDTDSYKQGYVKGVLAMANHGKNTNSSQFFIMLGDVAIPHLYTIFGKVVAGQDVVDKIGKAEIIPNLQMNPEGTDGTPKEPVVIEKAVISTK